MISEEDKVKIGAYMNACIGLTIERYEKGLISYETNKELISVLKTIKDNIKSEF